MKIPIDEAGWSARTPPIVFIREGGYYRFLIPGLSGSADARIVGDDIEVMPKQATTHRALCARLGVPAADA